MRSKECAATSCARPKEAGPRRAERELDASARTLLRHVDALAAKGRTAAPRERRRIAWMADLLAGVLGARAPAALRALAVDVTEHGDAARREGIAAFAASLWRHLAELGALDTERADAIASRLSSMIDAPATLLCFEHDAGGKRLARAQDHFARALDKRFPRFRSAAPRVRIDRAMLDAAGVPLDGRGLEVDFWPSGHLRAFRRGGLALTLERRPGVGAFREEGKRGGYGYAVSEHYADGAARGVLCSPWHDGDEYCEPTPWPVWVLQCARAVSAGGP